MEFNCVTVDPGVHTALAIWRDGLLVKVVTYNLKGTDDGMLLYDLSNKLKYEFTVSIRNIFSNAVLVGARIVIEDIMLYTSSAKSMASGARGNLTTLSKIAGAVGYYFSTHGAAVEFVAPGRWKGQLNYKQLRNILKVKFNIETKHDHEASAIGIGLWAQGRF